MTDEEFIRALKKAVLGGVLEHKPPKPIKAPERLTKEIRREFIRRKGWEVPWALIVDKTGRLWFEYTSELHRNKGGTAEMYVEILENRGVRVKIPHDYQLSDPEDVDEFCLPVVEIIE